MENAESTRVASLQKKPFKPAFLRHHLLAANATCRKSKQRHSRRSTTTILTFGLGAEFLEFSERKVSRLCQDRCELINSHIGRDIRQIRLLDVGCSMGYMSLFFSSIGAKVTGIDNNADQVAFCETLARYHNCLPPFVRLTSIRRFCAGIAEGEYDIVFLFSVLHHVIVKYGFGDDAGTMVSRLLDVADLYCMLS